MGAFGCLNGGRRGSATMCKERVGMMVIFGVEGSKTKEENGREGELVG